MTAYKHRRFGIVAAADRDRVNAALDALGYGPNNYSIPMIRTNDRNTARPTKYLCDIALTDEMQNDFAGVLGVSGEFVDAGELATPDRLKDFESAQGIRRKPT